MKYIKMLGLAAVAAAALMAFVGASSASATVLCSEPLTTGCAAAGKDYPKGTVIEATSTGVGILTTTGGTKLDECEDSTLVGETTNTGSSTETVDGPITTLDWGTCSKTTDTVTNGSLEIHWISEPKPNGSDNGTITVSGTEVTINTIFGTCTYTTSDVGVLEGGNPAKITITKLPVKKTAGNATCPAETLWTDSFEVKSPKPLYVSTN